MSSSESSKHGSVNPIALASSRKISTFGFVSPGAARAGRAICKIIVAVGEIKVGVFQERRHRQHDVGVIGCIRLELLQNDGEQILASQAFEDRALIRRNRRGVRVVNDQRFDRRVRRLVQGVSNWHMLTNPGQASAADQAAPKRRRSKWNASDVES